MEVEEDHSSWRGTHISQLQTSLNRSQFPELIINKEHTILFRIPVRFQEVPECFPSIFNKRDFWDDHHVKLPSSREYVMPGENSQWTLIRNALNSQILSSEQLQAAILTYNPENSDKWNFFTLHSFFKEVFDEMETAIFFKTLLPKIINLALRLPELITDGIPLLEGGRRHSVSISQVQISCLLANAFLCTFPRETYTRKNAKSFKYPDINFNKLFQCYAKDRTKSVQEKIKCILNYFRRVTSQGVVTYSRQFVPDNLLPDWSKSNKKLPRLYVSSEGTIENEGFGLLQIDFANKLVGGGVIRTGCVQEEIRFVVCPELIISRLFTERLGPNEALIITGCEQFNKYKGYASAFEWDGDYVDGTPSDASGRKYCTVIALDAKSYIPNPYSQYFPENVLRDINKAYVGFSWGSRRNKEELCAVATGNWGCGVFQGDPELKSFLQLMAAGEVGRDVAYFTFGNSELRDRMARAHQFLVENEITVGKLFNLLNVYQSKELFKSLSLFEFFLNEGLKKTEMFEMECDTPKLKDSNDLSKLDITKRSFCCRTKINDWFSPVTKASSSQNNFTESKPETEHFVFDEEKLKSFYQMPANKQPVVNETQSAGEDCFEFLNNLKNKMKKPRTLSLNSESSSYQIGAEKSTSSLIKTSLAYAENQRIENAVLKKIEKTSIISGNVLEENSKTLNSNLKLSECVKGADLKKSSVCNDFLNDIVQITGMTDSSAGIESDKIKQSAKSGEEAENINATMWMSYKCDEKSHSGTVAEVEGVTHDGPEIEGIRQENVNKNLDKYSLRHIPRNNQQSHATEPKNSNFSTNELSVCELPKTYNISKKQKISDYFSPKIK